MLFGGFFLTSGTSPVYLDWIRYISWFYYGNEALTINQWRGITFTDAACPNNTCTGTSIIESFNFSEVLLISLYNFYKNYLILNYYVSLKDFFYRDIGLLFALIVGFRILAFLFLLKKTIRKN